MDWSYGIRLRNLQMLVRLCERRNMSQVAQEFSVTQPALSKWLKEFEASLGAPLFERHARGVEPLPLAFELARQAKGIVGRLDRASTIVQQMKNSQAGQIAVGVSPMVALVLLPDVLHEFHRRHPSVFIQIHEDTLDQLNSKLETGELDVVIGRIDEGGIPPDVHYQKLGDVPLCLAVCASHPLAGKPHVTWDEALSYPWIAPPFASPIRQRMERAFEALGLKSPPVLVESSFASTSARLVEGTDFVAPMAVTLAKSLGLTTTLNVRWVRLGMHGSMGLLWRPEDQDVALIQSFMQCVREQAAANK
jgi:DNA-binding transcriptional LysR family regulator